MKRVVITGIGHITPLGTNSNDFYENLLNGNSPLSREKLAYFNHGDSFPSIRINQKIKDLLNNSFFNLKKYPNGIKYTLYSVSESIKSAKLDKEMISKLKPDLLFGNSEGDPGVIEEYIKEPNSGNLLGLSGYEILNIVSDELNLKGECISFHNTCSSAHIAIDFGVNQIKNGDKKISIVGATDPFSLKIQAGFDSLNALSPKGCQPFDEERKGITISEGSISFVIEELEHALSRKAEIFAEILGTGISNDAFHLTMPNVEGIKKAIYKCAKDADVSLEEIDTIFAHATGTTANDATEAEIFNQLFPNKPYICAIKSTLGHMMSAAGAANTLSAVLSFKRNILPPSLNTNVVDTNIKINLVHKEPIFHKPNIILSNAYGFGGNNAVVILKRYIY